MAREREGGDYSRKAIISNISVKGGGGGDYSREAINRGTAIIRGNTVGERVFVNFADYGVS